MGFHDLGVEGVEAQAFELEWYRVEEHNYIHLEISGYVLSFGIEYRVQEVASFTGTEQELEAIHPDLFHKSYLAAVRFQNALSDLYDVFWGMLNHDGDIAEWFQSKSKPALRRYIEYTAFLMNHVEFTDEDSRNFWHSAYKLCNTYWHYEDAQPGYIYLLRAVTPDNHYKIGLSKEPVKRIESMGVLLPFPIEPLHVFPTNHRFKAEKTLHNRYSDKRVNGEWFCLSEQDVQDICQIDKMQVQGVRI